MRQRVLIRGRFCLTFLRYSAVRKRSSTGYLTMQNRLQKLRIPQFSPFDMIILQGIEYSPKMIEVPEAKKFEPSVLDAIVKLIFYAHLIVATIYVTTMIAIYPSIGAPSVTFATLIIYGYMIVWVALINLFLLVIYWLSQCINRSSWSFWLVRIGIKLLITIFPIFGLVSYYQQGWLAIIPIFWFMAYLLIFSVLYILYEVTAYFCCERTNPDWVYRVSKDDLSTIKNTIAGKRKEFSDHNNL